MTRAEFREARLALGLSQRLMGLALGIAESSADRTVRRWEGGQRDVPGPVAQLTRLLVRHRELLEEVLPE